MKKMFDKAIQKKCEYCIYGSYLSEAELICKRKGIVGKDDLCRKYKYDPLKRIPQRPKLADDFSAKDFSL